MNNKIINKVNKTERLTSWDSGALSFAVRFQGVFLVNCWPLRIQPND